ncbi:hypothetical protein BC829DRAFT_391177 [Chytridium lagenaria]|nr:hypothetical protein BC829DRAFT_391177 [Chytridium lagenaria]
MQQQSDIRSTVEDGSGFMEGFQSTERADRNRDDAVSSSGLMKGCGMDEKTTATSSFTDLFIADEGTVDREIGLIFDSVVTKGGPMVGVGAVDRAIGMTLDSVVTKDIPMVGVAKAHKEGTRGQEYTKDLHMQHSHHYKLKPWYNDTRKLTTANSHERRRKSLMIENADKEETRIKRHRYRSPSSEPAIYSRHRNVPLFLEEFQCKSRDPSVGRMRSNSATTFTVNTDNDICDGGYDHWQKIEEWRSKATPDDKVRIAGWLNAIAKKGDQPVRRDLEKTVVYFGNRVDFESIIPLLVNVEFDDIAAERLQICVKQFSTRGESTRSEYIAIQAKYLVNTLYHYTIILYLMSRHGLPQII